MSLCRPLLVTDSISKRTDEQEDEDGDGHHEGGVPIDGDGLDEPRLEDLTPPGAQTSPVR